MKIRIIAALTRKHVIASRNVIPWHMPADLRRFKELTLGKPIIMGRKCHQSIGRVLPNRHNIVLSRSTEFKAPGATVVRSLLDALAAAQPAEEAFIIGGAEIYALALPVADTLSLTWIEEDVSGDTYFPTLDTELWQKVHDEPHPSDTENPYAYTFCEYTRIVE